MNNQQQRLDGTWGPAEPLPVGFGVVWEQKWRQRWNAGEWLLPALVRGWFDARAALEATP